MTPYILTEDSVVSITASYVWHISPASTHCRNSVPSLRVMNIRPLPWVLSLCTQPYTTTLTSRLSLQSLSLILLASGRLGSIEIVIFLASSALFNLASSASFSAFSLFWDFLTSCCHNFVIFFN